MIRAAAVIAAVIGLAGCGGASHDDAAGGAATTGAATTPAAPKPHARAFRHQTALLRHATALRATPGGRRLARIATRTQFRSPTVLAVVARRAGWLEVISSALPNGRHGWIPAWRATLYGTDVDIAVDRSQRRATLRRAGRVLLRFPVAVGRPGNETPLGRFAVTDKLRVTSPSSAYGCCALALSGHQTKIEPGWPGGTRLAIHGTPAPSSIGHAVSLGCMRAGERVLRRLLRSVPLGAPVVVRA